MMVGKFVFSFAFTTLLLGVCLCPVESLDNGLALRPPMGWMAWLKYACNIDCARYPDECINERLFRAMIDRLAEDGWVEAGYNTVNIDDCWMEFKRDSRNLQLVPNRERFPSGIHSLANYALAKGVQLGIYEDVGTKTCGGYPGTRGSNGEDYTEIDAKTFHSWNVTSLKLDGCYQSTDMFNKTYPHYSRVLAKFAPNIVYACSWPAYLIDQLSDDDYRIIQKNCNYWRNFDDIMDSWESVQTIIDFYGQQGHIFQKFHGPGGWFDADMLLIGNDGLSYEQSKTQMAFWCLWSVPLLMSNDLRNIEPRMKSILLNKRLLNINQDALGRMGTRVTQHSTKTRQVWVKKMAPIPNGDPYAVLYFNNATLGVPAIMSHRLIDIIPDMDVDGSFLAYDLFDDTRKPLGKYSAFSNLTLKVKTSGSVRMIHLVPDSNEFFTQNWVPV